MKAGGCHIKKKKKKKRVMNTHYHSNIFCFRNSFHLVAVAAAAVAA